VGAKSDWKKTIGEVLIGDICTSFFQTRFFMKTENSSANQRVWQVNTTDMNRSNPATKNNGVTKKKQGKRNRLALSCNVCRKRKVKVSFQSMRASICSKDKHER